MTVSSTNLSFGATNPTTSTFYNLSDAVGFKGSASLTGVDSTSTITIFHTASSGLASSATATFLGTTTPALDAAKTDVSLDLALASTSETTSTIYCYFNYNETLVSTLYNVATGKDFDIYDGSSVILACDFDFKISLVSGAIS